MITRMTALMIQNHPDETDGEGISCDSSDPYPNGKYAGWITFWRGGRPHISPLLSTEPVYLTPQEAKSEMKRVVSEIRASGMDA